MTVICAFPGVGKSYVVEHMQAESKFSILDSDSSNFPKDNFPQNYIDYIKSVMNTHKILVSTHQLVRDALFAANIPYDIVVPNFNCRDEYMQRYLNRTGFNGGEKFAKLLNDNWDAWVMSCHNDPNANRIYILKHGEYLASLFEQLPHVLEIPHDMPEKVSTSVVIKGILGNKVFPYNLFNNENPPDQNSIEPIAHDKQIVKR